MRTPPMLFACWVVAAAAIILAAVVGTHLLLDLTSSVQAPATPSTRGAK